MVIPVNAPGLKVISRRSYSRAATSLFDYPLSRRFDETDSFVVFDNVFVPWENVFIYRNIELARAQWFETPAHVLGNHQAQIRYAAKMRFVMGLAKRITQMNGIENQPAVQGMLGEMGAYAVLHDGLVVAQEEACTIDRNGVAVPGRREHYANQVFQTVHHSTVMNMFRELVGGGVLQVPSSFEDYDNPEIAAHINRYIRSPGSSSLQRVELMKLAWDMIGSEFAGRHQQYEKFFAGAPFIVRSHVYREYDFGRAMGMVDAVLDPAKREGYDAGRL
jgi:4-hydroxyphenylacetate 3-monooxygenase